MHRWNRPPTAATSRRPLAVLAASILALGLSQSGCSKPPPATDYYPLQKGLRWSYEFREHNRVTNSRRELDMRNLGQTERDGRHFVKRLASDGNEYWIEHRNGHLVRSGVRTAIDREPRLDVAPITVLPSAPEEGQSWEIETRPFILERVEPFRERFAQDASKRITLRMQVASLDDTVEVPAGRFEHCLRVEGSGVLTVLADARIGASEVPVTQTEWYAPGVGLIKLEREEQLDTAQIVGGQISLQLLAFEP